MTTKAGNSGHFDLYAQNTEGRTFVIDAGYQTGGQALAAAKEKAKALLKNYDLSKILVHSTYYGTAIMHVNLWEERRKANCLPE